MQVAGSFPASTSPAVASSRVRTSSTCATPVTRWNSPLDTTPKVPTSWCSSTSPRRPTIVDTTSTWCTRSPSRSTSRSRSVAASARWRMPAACCGPGADKVSVNTAAVQRPELIGEIAAEFGSQCVVCAIDAKRRSECRRCRVRGLRPRWSDADRHRRRGVGDPGRRARRGRDPAHVDGPGRHAGRVRQRAHQGDRRLRCRCR